jgi:hypothetical protein
MCITCGHAHTPSGVINHAKTHGVIRAHTFKSVLDEYVLEHNISRSYAITHPPPPNASPITGLRIYEGFRCPIAYCPGASGTQSTMEEHYRIEHRKDEVPSRGHGRFVAAHIQSFFTQPRLKWFSVNIDLMNVPNIEVDTYSRLILDYLPSLTQRPNITPVLNRDRTMLAQLTDWDTHLGPHIKTPKQCRKVLDLIVMPTEKDDPDLFPIIVVFREYMTTTEALLRQVPIIARRILHKFPVYVPVIYLIGQHH